MTREQMIAFLVDRIRAKTPIRTGNLRASTISKRVNENTWEIYVNAGDDPYAKYERGTAPYVPFVNEPWISDFWGGKINPNQGYWNKAVVEAIEELRARVGGELSND